MTKKKLVEWFNLHNKVIEYYWSLEEDKELVIVEHIPLDYGLSNPILSTIYVFRYNYLPKPTEDEIITLLEKFFKKPSSKIRRADLLNADTIKEICWYYSDYYSEYELFFIDYFEEKARKECENEIVNANYNNLPLHEDNEHWHYEAEIE